MSDPETLDPLRQPLLAHLIELRRRLIWSLLAVLAGFIVCYIFAPEIYAFLVRPWPKQRPASRGG